MFKITELSKKSEDLKLRTIETLKEAKLDYSIDFSENEKIRLVFAGQYSAGKSSITLLTGRDDIAIGGGITTQESHSYEWKGLEVIDTPGIHTELRPDHDEISYAQIK